MKVAVFSAKPDDRQFLGQVNQKYDHELKFLTAGLAKGFEAICVFVNDRLDRATIQILSSQIGYLGLDVYEQEGKLFFEDLSGEIIQDDVFQRLLTFPNVIITGHQAFFTAEALNNIAETTLCNITAIALNQPCEDLSRLASS